MITSIHRTKAGYTFRKTPGSFELRIIVPDGSSIDLKDFRGLGMITLPGGQTKTATNCYAIANSGNQKRIRFADTEAAKAIPASASR